MGLLSKINDISSKIGVMLSKLADDYANADLGRFTDIKAAPANQQLALFKKRLEAIRPAAAREPVRALDTVLHSIPHLAKDNQWEAYQTVLSDRIFSDGIRAADGNSDSLNKAFRTIWRFRNTTYLQTFQQFLRCEAFHSHRMFPGCVQDEMFFIIQKMPKNDQQKALEEVFCTPRVKTILNDRDYSAKWFTESLFKFLIADHIGFGVNDIFV